MQIIEKNKIKQKFIKSLVTYNQNANVQKLIADKLFEIYVLQQNNFPENVLEIGCGTGFLTQKICSISTIKNLYINDLVGEVRPIINNIIEKNNVLNSQFLIGDAENINFPMDLDLIMSSSVFQWFHNFNHFLKKVNLSLNKNGILAFSSFAEQNFKEINFLTNNGLNYYSINDYKQILNQQFEILHLEENIISLTFENPLEVIKHIKSTGTNANNRLVWTKSRLQKFEHDYILNFSSQQKVILTYHPIYCILKKLGIKKLGIRN